MLVGQLRQLVLGEGELPVSDPKNIVESNAHSVLLAVLYLSWTCEPG